MPNDKHTVRFDPNMKISLSVIALWIVFFAADSLFGLMPLLSGKGFSVITGEYYRIFTAFLLHGNVIHLLINAAAMFDFGHILEKHMGSKRFFTFSVFAMILGQIVYYVIFPTIDNVFGGSILTFTYIGQILTIKLFQCSDSYLHSDSGYTHWIWIYAIAGNIPVFPFMNLTTVALHVTGLLSGFLTALLYMCYRRRKNVK